MQKGLLPVVGAHIYHQQRGSGPLLLIIPGGPGDADASAGLVRHLENSYRVVTFDRRGQSRSPLDKGAGVAGVETHCDDVHLLLESLTQEPVFVLGSSLGALIGLDLVARYPEQVSALVAHEPPSTDLLDASHRAAAVQDREKAEELFHRDGVLAALRKFIEFTGVRRDGREADAEVFRPTAATTANAEFFFACDAPAVRGYRLDLEKLRKSPVRIVPAAGSTNRDVWLHQCGRGLAAQLGQNLVEFPGGHGAFSSHPRGFASKLHEVFRLEENR